MVLTCSDKVSTHWGLVLLQVQYSLLSCGPQQQEIRAVCQDLGVQLIAYSPLALGMLSGTNDSTS